MDEQNYAGFWVRTGAHVIDTILVMLILSPLIGFVSGGSDIDMTVFVAGEASLSTAYLIGQVLPPAVAVIAFWYYKSATPGKMIFKLKIVDLATGEKPSIGQLVGRYFAYIISAIPLLLGFIWVGFDAKKQGWHDKLASTVVTKG